MTALAFHNDPQLAERIRGQVAAHTAADEIAQGKYWENGKGCFIGCIAHSSNVTTVEQLTGFPIMLTRIAESIFEGLPNDVAKGFPGRVIAAPKVGANLDLVSWRFLRWLVEDALTDHADEATRAACQPAMGVLAAKARGGTVSTDAAAYAADAADAAYVARAAYAAADAADAAYVARAACAAYVAYAASAASAAADAASAARAAYAASAASAAARAARAADAAYVARIKQADKLVELLELAE